MHVFIWCHNMFSITAQAGHNDSLKLLTTLLALEVFERVDIEAAFSRGDMLQQDLRADVGTEKGACRNLYGMGAVCVR